MGSELDRLPRFEITSYSIQERLDVTDIGPTLAAAQVQIAKENRAAKVGAARARFTWPVLATSAVSAMGLVLGYLMKSEWVMGGALAALGTMATVTAWPKKGSPASAE
jgi:hypothetical protein